MKYDTILRVLRATRNLISDKKNWTTNANARDEYGNPSGIHDRATVQWCALGALWKNIDYLTDVNDVSLLYNVLGKHLPGNNIFALPVINDDKKQGHSFVLEVFDKTISDLEALNDSPT